jgi:hypothetical protein
MTGIEYIENVEGGRTPHHKEKSNAGTLYVFLHGLIGVRCQGPGQGIELLIPDVGTEHSYRIGEFIGETTLQPSPAPYHLRNVDAGPVESFDPGAHLVTNELHDLCDGAKLYARILLPGAAAIHSVLKVDLSGVIEDPAGRLCQTKIATMIPVLEYSFRDPRKVALSGDRLNVAPIKDKDGHWYMNLHIFAEEDLERTDDHTLGGFDAVAALFDFDCPPRLASVANIPVPYWGPRPKGTTKIEFASLALRTRELGYLGRSVREDILKHVPAVVHVSSVGADPLTCTPLITQLSNAQSSGENK